MLLSKYEHHHGETLFVYDIFVSMSGATAAHAIFETNSRFHVK